MPDPTPPVPRTPKAAASAEALVEKPLGAVARFLGHSAAAAVGFVGLAIISLIPIAAVRALHAIGLADLESRLQSLEAVLGILDLVLLLAVLLAGAAVLVTEVYVEAERRIISTFKRRRS
jgi:hypothetical protein